MSGAGAQDLREIVGAIWSAMLDFDVREVAAQRPGNGSRPHLVGSVEVSGAWSGTVEVDCAPELARLAAGAMFGRPPERITPEETLDAVGEIANITGGNVKALVPGPSRLSLPAVGEAAATPTARPVLARVLFECGGLPLSIRVLGGDAA